MSEKCETCKHGIAQLANFNAWKDKKMSYTELLLKQASYGGICVKCIYATMGQKQVRKLKKRKIPYHSEDCYIPDVCLDCKSNPCRCDESLDEPDDIQNEVMQ